MEQGSHQNLIDRVRQGDAEAAAELVQCYLPVIRSRIRIWLRMQDPRLRRVFEAMDICQSVLASFFVRAATGQYDLDRPERLTGLLVSMARNKLADQIVKPLSMRRDGRRDEEAGARELPLLAPDAVPAGLTEGRELLEEVRRRLTDQERALVDFRGQGQDWITIARQMGGTPDQRRMQLGLALDRISQELGLDAGRYAALEG